MELPGPRASRRHRGGLWLSALLLLVVRSALALPPPRADVNRYGEGGLLELPRATSLGEGRSSAGLWFNYYTERGGVSAARLSPLSLGAALPWRFDAAASLSVHDAEDPELRSGRTTQFQLSLKWQALAQPRFPLAVSTLLRAKNLLTRPELMPMLAVDRAFRQTALTALGGYRFTTGSGPAAALFGAGVEQQAGDRVALLAEVLGAFRPADRALELKVGLAMRVALPVRLGVIVGVEADLAATGGLRLVIGLRYAPSSSKPEDSDEDGVPDDRDFCPEQPEDIDGYEDGDGCPDPVHARGLADQRHRGPVLMRLVIPEQPIPVWIMRSDGKACSEPPCPPSEAVPSVDDEADEAPTQKKRRDIDPPGPPVPVCPAGYEPIPRPPPASDSPTAVPPEDPS